MLQQALQDEIAALRQRGRQVDKFRSPVEKCIEQADMCRQLGNKLVNEQAWSEAKQIYTEGINLINVEHWEGNDRKDSKIKLKDEEASRKNVLLKASLALLYTNRALVYMHLGEYKESERDATDAIECNPKNAKSFFRRAAASIELGEWTSAREDLNVVLELDTSNRTKRDVIQMKQKLRDAIRKYDREDPSNNLRRIFSSFNPNISEDKNHSSTSSSGIDAGYGGITKNPRENGDNFKVKHDVQSQSLQSMTCTTTNHASDIQHLYDDVKFVPSNRKSDVIRIDNLQDEYDEIEDEENECQRLAKEEIYNNALRMQKMSGDIF